MLGDIDWNTGTIAVVCIFAVPIIAVVCSFWYKIEQVRSDNALKQSMIDRGMSADEIERVISAQGHAESKEPV